MDKETIKIVRDIIMDAEYCAMPQVSEEYAKATLRTIARRLKDMLAKCVTEG
jgi:hypothetical protein